VRALCQNPLLILTKQDCTVVVVVVVVVVLVAELSHVANFGMP